MKPGPVDKGGRNVQPSQVTARSPAPTPIASGTPRTEQNMALDDLLELLARWGSLSLSRTRFPFGGSPHLRGKPVLWRCELRVPGYTDSDIKCSNPSFVGEGPDPRTASEHCFVKAETYFASAKAGKDRSLYMDYYGNRPDRGGVLPDVNTSEAPALSDELIR